jgi:hypothetical protein
MSIRRFYKTRVFLHLGNQLSVFNSQSQVQLGGKWHRAKQRIERPFIGVIAGVVFNGIRVLDLAADKDPGVGIRGEVQPIPSLPAHIKEKPLNPSVELLHRMQQVGDSKNNHRFHKQI